MLEPKRVKPQTNSSVSLQYLSYISDAPDQKVSPEKKATKEMQDRLDFQVL